jgi:hypothetical protein
MSWIPVLFACLAGNQCAFVYDIPTFSESKCEKALTVMLQKFEDRPEVIAVQGTCIPVTSA